MASYLYKNVDGAAFPVSPIQVDGSVLEGDQGIVKGYYTLSSASIKKDILPEKIVKILPSVYGDLPVTLV